jgi:hypothetical protein
MIVSYHGWYVFQTFPDIFLTWLCGPIAGLVDLVMHFNRGICTLLHSKFEVNSE